jgi:hypothetical protein
VSELLGDADRVGRNFVPALRARYTTSTDVTSGFEPMGYAMLGDVATAACAPWPSSVDGTPLEGCGALWARKSAVFAEAWSALSPCSVADLRTRPNAPEARRAMVSVSRLSNEGGIAPRAYVVRSRLRPTRRGGPQCSCLTLRRIGHGLA